MAEQFQCGLYRKHGDAFPQPDQPSITASYKSSNDKSVKTNPACIADVGRFSPERGPFFSDGGKRTRLIELELRKEKAEGRISRLQPTPHLPPASAGGAVESRDQQPASAGLVIGLQTEWPATCKFTSCSECGSLKTNPQVG